MLKLALVTKFFFASIIDKIITYSIIFFQYLTKIRTDGKVNNRNITFIVEFDINYTSFAYSNVRIPSNV